LPLYVTAPTLAASRLRCDLGPLTDIRRFRSGDSFTIGALTVETLPTPHDGADGVAFIVSDGHARLGILTDLGHPFRGLARILSTLNGVFLESNYDPDMLENGPYPGFLKQRIRGPQGHLSNFESAFLLEAAGGGLAWACLAHLSEVNNTPQVALATHSRILGDRIPLSAASRHEPTGVFRL
jgi:phosphoribosyl 1,2-cyclic phosphodiesterase